MNAALLRALVGAQDSLRAAMCATDDLDLRDRIRAEGERVGNLLLAVVRDQGERDAAVTS